MSFKRRVRKIAIIAASIAKTGITHSEVFRNALSRCRPSQDMGVVSHHQTKMMQPTGVWTQEIYSNNSHVCFRQTTIFGFSGLL